MKSIEGPRPFRAGATVRGAGAGDDRPGGAVEVLDEGLVDVVGVGVVPDRPGSPSSSCRPPRAATSRCRRFGMAGPEVGIVVDDTEGAAAEHAYIVGFAGITDSSVVGGQAVVVGQCVELGAAGLPIRLDSVWFSRMRVNTWSYWGNEASLAVIGSRATDKATANSATRTTRQARFI
jgi:hypothetical protein